MHACTIVARNYLAHAQVLTDSFFEQHPDGTMTVLLIDDPGQGRVEIRGAEVVLLDEIGIESDLLEELTLGYTLIELATSVKPWLLRALLARGWGHAVYFDPDILVTSRMDELAELALAHSVVLTPHLTEPMPRDGHQPAEQDILLAGTFNLGFIAVGNTGAGRAMLDWWSERLITDAFVDPGRGFFTDQRVIDLVPGLFDHLVVRDPSWNVAYWNLATRPLTRVGGEVQVHGQALRFFHFSGFRADQPHLLSRHQGRNPRILLSQHPVLAELCHAYAERLIATGRHDQESFEPPFSHHDGVRLAPLVRQLIRAELRRRRLPGLEPEYDAPVLGVGSRGGLGLATWLASPDPGGSVSGLGRLMSAIHAQRPDLRAVYPEVLDGDVSGLLSWAEEYGIDEMGVPADTIVVERFRLAAGPESSFLKHPTAAQPDAKPIHGVEVLGYFTAELGIAQSARQVVAGLIQAGVPTSTSTYTRTLSRRGATWSEHRGLPGRRADTLLLCINADQTPYALADAGPAYLERRRRIGMWFWELEELPTDMCSSIELVDEIWVSSDFNAATLRQHTERPVVVLPLPVHAPAKVDATLPELADDHVFTYLFVFDFLSVAERKNPWGLIEAFSRAFPEPGTARLIIKSINGEQTPLDLERLRFSAVTRSDVVLIERHLSRAELDALMWGSDCYVSLHRSEGFGQTIAEMMAIAKPVIATAYSGNLMFMDEENSYLVDHQMTNVPEGAEPYPTTARWAEPDLDHAAALMRAVLDDPTEAQRRGKAAAERIHDQFSTDAFARAARTRLDEIWS